LCQCINVSSFISHVVFEKDLCILASAANGVLVRFGFGSIPISTWHGPSHARCAIVEHIATMRVQNYAGSRIKVISNYCRKCSCDLFALFLQQLATFSTDTETDRRACPSAIAKLLFESKNLMFSDRLLSHRVGGKLLHHCGFTKNNLRFVWHFWRPSYTTTSGALFVHRMTMT